MVAMRRGEAMPSSEPLFCDTVLAHRIERAEAQLIARAGEAARRRAPAAGGFVVPIAGGVACFAEPDSPFNKVAGLGFDGVPAERGLAEVEQAFAAVGAAVQVELATLADPGLGAFLTGRGYRLESFENVLGRTIDSEHALLSTPGVEVRRSREDELDAWLNVLVDAVAHPDTQGVPSHEDFPRETLMAAERDLVAAGLLPYIAFHDGVVAGGASLGLAEGVAQMGGAGTAPAHRRRGIQSAMLSARLVDAAAAGCDIAVVTTQPGSRSHHNVQRQGYHLLYTRAILIKRP
jgi:ribosomal protein S18 acetylase RimI-like enzyme